VPDRLEISLRLKAGRWLAGTKATTGRQQGSAVPLTTDALANHPVLLANRITKNRLEDIEQMRNGEARSMELEKIAEALGLPAAWFQTADEMDLDASTERAAQRGLPVLLAGARALRQGSAPQLRDVDAQGRQAGSSEAPDG
jgi:3-hydroxyacyl-CoA dehydrogenase